MTVPPNPLVQVCWSLCGEFVKCSRACRLCGEFKTKSAPVAGTTAACPAAAGPSTAGTYVEFVDTVV